MDDAPLSQSFYYQSYVICVILSIIVRGDDLIDEAAFFLVVGQANTDNFPSQPYIIFIF